MTAKKAPQIFAALSATMGGFALGTVLGWSSPAMLTIAEKYEFGDTVISFIGAITTLGAATAMLPMPLLVDMLGRRKTIIILTIPFTLSWLLLAFAKSAALFLMGRFLTGFFGGAFCVVTPIYIGEVAQKDIRGSLGVCFQLLLVFGILYSYAVGPFVSLLALGLTSAVFPVIVLILMLFLPETPLYLALSNSKPEEIEKAFNFLRGKEYDFKDELKEINQTVAEIQARKAVNKLEKFKTKVAIKAFLMCVLLQAVQQLSGINAVIFYTESIFKIAASSMSSSTCGIIVGIVQVFSTFPAVVLVEKLGRKKLFALSLIIMTFCLFLLGLYFILTKHNEDRRKSLSWLPLFSICAYILGFSLGTGPLPWAMLGELFSPDIKGVAGSICAAINWLLAFLVTSVYVPVQNALTPAWTFWMFAIICLAGAVLIFMFVLETRNKTLEQIQKELGGET